MKRNITDDEVDEVDIASGGKIVTPLTCHLGAADLLAAAADLVPRRFFTELFRIALLQARYVN